MTKQLVILSDIHCGSRLAVSPERFTEADGTTHIANPVQKALYKAWEEVVAEWGRPDILVLNGEPIDGQQPKDLGVEAWTTNYLEQVRAAARLVTEFQAKQYFVTRGSNYHVQQGGISVEEHFGAQIGAKEIDGRHVQNELFLDVEGTTLNFAHHIAGSASGWMYRSTPPAKEMMLQQLNISHKWPFDVLVRSHNHYFWAVMSSSKMAVLTPSWKLQDWYGMRKSSAGTIPDIGAIRFLVNGKDYRLEKKIFRLQEARPPKVSIK